MLPKDNLNRSQTCLQYSGEFIKQLVDIFAGTAVLLYVKDCIVNVHFRNPLQVMVLGGDCRKEMLSKFDAIRLDKWKRLLFISI